MYCSFSLNWVLKKFTFVCLFAFLVSCEGTSSKYYDTINLIENEQESGKILIYRDTGLSGTLGVLWVKLNGKEVGKLKNYETFVHKVKPGTYVLEINDWIKFVGKKPIKKRINITSKENKYFILNLKEKLWGREEMVIYETSKSIWNSTASE